jgi:hypothetical protein
MEQKEKKMAEGQGKFEHQKYDKLRPEYSRGFQEILDLDFEKGDYVNHFPAFIGHMTLARFISLYEAYKMTLEVGGHIAEVGVFKAAGSLFFAKLIRIFEPSSLTLVHGFDWFQGAKTTEEEKYVVDGECKVDYDMVMDLIRAQGYENSVHIHNIDIAEELGSFFEENPHLQFKLVFLDCGVYDVVSASIEHFWPRMTKGGIMIFDHYSHEFAPGEMRAIREFLPNAEIKAFPFGWMPAAYIVK